MFDGQSGRKHVRGRGRIAAVEIGAVGGHALRGLGQEMAHPHGEEHTRIRHVAGCENPRPSSCDFHLANLLKLSVLK